MGSWVLGTHAHFCLLGFLTAWPHGTASVLSRRRPPSPSPAPVVGQLLESRIECRMCLLLLGRHCFQPSVDGAEMHRCEQTHLERLLGLCVDKEAEQVQSAYTPRPQARFDSSFPFLLFVTSFSASEDPNSRCLHCILPAGAHTHSVRAANPVHLRENVSARGLCPYFIFGL